MLLRLKGPVVLFLRKWGEGILFPVIISSTFNYIARGIFLSLVINVAYKQCLGPLGSSHFLREKLRWGPLS